MYKSILLPTDGSEPSRRAVAAGVIFAKELGAAVIGLTVTPEFHTITYKTEMLEDTPEEFALASQKRAQQLLDDIASQARGAGVTCSCEHAISDHPYEAILEAAAKHRCDLIVMASHGRSGLKGLLLGSETQKVLVHSSIPVLVHR
jgi:nucleotide-binding universal stress UspA family protein